MLEIFYFWREGQKYQLFSSTAPQMRVVLGATKLSDQSNPEFRVKEIVKANYNA